MSSVKYMVFRGGWFILGDWNIDDFDPKQVLKNLHVKYGVTPFFKILVEPDPYSPDQNIIRISPSGLGLPDREYYYRDQEERIQSAYKELIRDVVKGLDSPRSETEKFGNDIFFYEKRIAEITPSSQWLANPINTCNHIRVAELRDTVVTIPFFDILTAMFPEANINASTEVIVTSEKYLTEISQIIASTDKKTMNGYLIWTLVRHYMPYLSEKFTSALHSFNAELYGLERPSKRWEICANFVQNIMGLAIDAFNEKSNPITAHTRSVVNETYFAILENVKDSLKTFNKKPELYRHLSNKLNNLRLQVGLPATVTKIEFIKNYYNKLRVIKASFFDSVRYAFEFKKKTKEIMLTQPGEEYTIIEMTKLIPEVSYAPSANLILIPNALLTSPYFESNYASPLIFGRLGVEISRAILSSILPYNSFWTTRKLLTPYHKTVNESLNSVYQVQKCLWNYILNANLDVPYDIANETALLTLHQISAVIIANKALQNLVSTRDHIHQPTLEEFEDAALYLLSYAQTQCSVSTSQYQLYDNIVNFKLSQRSSLLLESTQIPEFKQSLDCSFVEKCPNIF